MKDENKVVDMVEVEEEDIVEVTKFSKVKSYIKGNWKKIAIAVGAITVGAIGYTLGKSDTIVYDLPPESTEDDVETVTPPTEE